MLTPARGATSGAHAPALEAVFRRDYARLVALARLLIDRPDEAEEIVQEAFVRAYAAGDRLETRDDPQAYVQRSVVNLARDGLRRRRTVRRTPMPVIASGDSADVDAVLDENQREILAALRRLPERQRVCVAMRYLAVTRRGTNGVDQVDTLGVTAALFRQHTSRTVDPQLHTHAVIAAKVQDPTGRWLALDARFLKQQQTTIGWIYDAALRAELTSRLGVAWRQKDGRPIDLDVVPKEVCDGFSERTEQVKAKLAELIGRWSAEHGGEDPDRQTIAGLERRAAVASRPPTVHGVDAVALHQEWSDQAEALEFDPALLIPERLAAGVSPPRPSGDALILEAIRRTHAESATWLRADLARHVSNLVPPQFASGTSDYSVESRPVNWLVPWWSAGASLLVTATVGASVLALVRFLWRWANRSSAGQLRPSKRAARVENAVTATGC